MRAIYIADCEGGEFKNMFCGYNFFSKVPKHAKVRNFFKKTGCHSLGIVVEYTDESTLHEYYETFLLFQ